MSNNLNREEKGVLDMADYQEKEMINLIFSMYRLSGGKHGEFFKKLTEKEQTVCRSIVFSRLFFNSFRFY